MVVVFVESKYILPKDITNVADEYFFACFLIIKGEKYAIEKVVLFIYKNNMQIRKKKIFRLL